MDNRSFTSSGPIIGVTADASAERFTLSRAYLEAIARAGGVPIILPCLPALADALLEICDGLVLTGGDDPIMPHWGVAMHPKATAVDPQRQAFELALLDALEQRPMLPVLGVCLGMQMMGLHAGGTLEQHLPDSLVTAGDHRDHRAHSIAGDLGRGTVHSHHHQALRDAGRLRVMARSEDGVIEAVQMKERPALYLGVQWHPERTDDEHLGAALFERLIKDARARMQQRVSK